MTKRKRVATEPIDTGAPMLARHFSVVPKLVDNSTRAMRVLDGSEIDAMLLHDLINPAQHSTLMALGKRLHGYGMVGLKSPDYSTRIHADPTLVASKKADSLRGAVHLITKMDQHHDIGPHRRKKLINLVLADQSWGTKRNQIEDLHFSIRALDEIFTGRR